MQINTDTIETHAIRCYRLQYQYEMHVISNVSNNRHGRLFIENMYGCMCDAIFLPDD